MMATNVEEVLHPGWLLEQVRQAKITHASGLSSMMPYRVWVKKIDQEPDDILLAAATELEVRMKTLRGLVKVRKEYGVS